MEDPRWGVGDESPIIESVKRKLGLDPSDGVFTEELVQRVRGLQVLHGLEANGLIDEELLFLMDLRSEEN